jgi:cysteine desulfurase
MTVGKLVRAIVAANNELDVGELGVDLLSRSTHKLHGPRGIGALCVCPGSLAAGLAPQVHGGGQERGLRSGTVAVPLVVGFGHAAVLCRQEMRTEATQLRAVADHLQARLTRELPRCRWHGHPERRLPGSLHLSIPGVEAAVLLGALDGVALRAGAACSSGLHHESHVLRGIGLSCEQMRGSLRFGPGRFPTEQDIDPAADELVRVVRALQPCAGSA